MGEKDEGEVEKVAHKGRTDMQGARVGVLCTRLESLLVSLVSQLPYLSDQGIDNVLLTNLAKFLTQQF